MKKQDIARQSAVALSVVLTIAINGLANALPINGLTTGEISDKFDVYFVPAGYVFSIWGLIYLGLLAHIVFQLLPAERENPRLRKTGWWVVLSGLANSGWIYLWHHEQFLATLPVMLVLLASLIAVYLKLGIGRSPVPRRETWLARVPFSLYLGWITVATIANVTVVLDYLQWDRFGLADQTWMVIVLCAVLVLAGVNLLTRRDAVYSAVILWALAGIGVKFPDAGMVTIATWAVFAGVALIGIATGIVGLTTAIRRT